MFDVYQNLILNEDFKNLGGGGFPKLCLNFQLSFK